MYRILKSEMAKKDMTQTVLSEKVGMHQSILSNKMNGKRGAEFRFNEAVRIKQALESELPLEELFTWEE